MSSLIGQWREIEGGVKEIAVLLTMVVVLTVAIAYLDFETNG